MNFPVSSISVLALALATGCAASPPPCPQPPAPAPPAPPAASTSSSPAEITPVVVVAEPGAPTAAALRQLPALPRPSPGAEVRQTIGLTDLALEYSSPGVRNRTIWGELVPFEKVWRAGANAPTKLTSNRDFTFGGKAVPAGSYSLFIIPTKAAWTVVLNLDPKNEGASEHDPKKDVARATVTPTDAPARERLTYLFENTTDERTDLVLDWAQKRVVVPITVATSKHADESIAQTLESAWRPLFNAGRYKYDHGATDEALGLLRQSIDLKPTWWNHWWAAQAFAKKGDHASARKHATEATKLGAKDDVFKRFFAENVKKTVAGWPGS